MCIRDSYIGEYRYKDIVTPGGIPAIVDKDLFDRVQQRFEQNKIAHGRPAKEDVSYLLTKTHVPLSRISC